MRPHCAASGHHDYFGLAALSWITTAISPAGFTRTAALRTSRRSGWVAHQVLADGSDYYFGDHYGARCVFNGVPEEYITGDKPDRERFQKFAAA